MAEWKLWSEEKPKEVTRDFSNRYHKSRHVEPGVVFNGEFLSDWSEYQIYSDAYSEPIAWMPFPEAYKGDKAYER